MINSSAAALALVTLCVFSAITPDPVKAHSPMQLYMNDSREPKRDRKKKNRVPGRV
tara:strand:- start:983 stop:1150 length:168 start_codon:yes stop_codon:yes gene_type:complete